MAGLMSLALPAAVLAVAVANTAPAASSSSSFFVWHITDVHVDPWYTVGSNAVGCFCETGESCPRKGAHCKHEHVHEHQAPPWGSSEGNCATPRITFSSAVDFMRKTKATPLVYFTGDFAQAGASVACGPRETAKQQVLDIMAWDWGSIKAQLPAAKVLGSLGNHDSVPGDVFYGGNENGNGSQSWLYNNLTGLWGADVGPGGLGTLKRGGYFSTVAAPNLTVISLNVNYWVHMNSAAVAPAGEAEGRRMMAWLEAELVTAEAGGHAVHILGHQPPTDKDMQPAWIDGYWPQYTALCERFKRSIQGHFYGHIHVDKWTLTRACREGPAPPPRPASGYVETRGGIRWCSGGGNYKPPANVFNTSLDGLCPLVPTGWDADRAAAEAEAVCTAAGKGCAGFTLYMHNTSSQIPREACFRTKTCSSKPASPGSTTRCYAKWEDQPNTTRPTICDGAASTVLIPGPSLTEGYPATNPSLRLLEFDSATYELLDMHTYTADLHAANRAGSHLAWELEYSFKSEFDMPDLSARSFELLAARLAAPAGDSAWEKYRGDGNGCLYVGGYSRAGAPFPPKDPTEACDGTCRASMVAELNATMLV